MTLAETAAGSLHCYLESRVALHAKLVARNDRTRRQIVETAGIRIHHRARQAREEGYLRASPSWMVGAEEGRRFCVERSHSGGEGCH